jgi:hypothetical protein
MCSKGESNCSEAKNISVKGFESLNITTFGLNATVGVILETDSQDGNNGPLSDDSEIGLIILFTLTTLFSIIGNGFVIIVFARGRRSRTDLRPFLINLAVCDLIMALFCMPFTFIYTMMGTWIFSEPMCPIVLFVQLLSVSGSVFTNMAIGIDRFMAVMYPLLSRLTKQRAKYVIVIVWTCSTALSSVQFKVAQFNDHGDGIISCQEQWENINDRKMYTIFIFVITYLIPLLILSITYSIVGTLLWKRISPGNRDIVRDMHQLRSKRKVRI